MASSKFRISFTVNDPAPTVKNKLDLGSPVQSLNNLANYILQFVSGVTSSTSIIATTAVSSTGTVTFSSFVENDTVTVGAVTLTGKDAPSGENQFAANGNDAADATAFAACVNAHSVLSKIVSASANSATVTLTCLIPGVIGNQIALAISAHGSVSGAVLASGAEDTNVTISHGGIVS